MRKFFFEKEVCMASMMAFGAACQAGGSGDWWLWAFWLAVSVGLNFVPAEVPKPEKN